MTSNLVENRGLEDTPGDTLRLMGGIGSPYSNKMLFYLRYRRIPFRWIMMHSSEERGTKHASGPLLLPKIVWPDNSVQNDSTFLVERLEREYAARSCYPKDKGLTFLALLLEDFADEFLTKCMYHYRWVHDPLYAGKGIAMQQQGLLSASDKVVAKFGSNVQKRQVGRLGIVGSNPVTGPAIEQFYEEFLQTLDKHFRSGHPYVLGTRPSVADFAILGQLHPMIQLDPNTSHITRTVSPRVCSWYSYCADLSGLSVLDESKGWFDASKPLPDTFIDLLKLVGKWYVPYLIANDSAFKGGRKSFEIELNDGNISWKQPTFKYQSKCLEWLRGKYLALSSFDKSRIDMALNCTGCMHLITQASPHSLSKL